MFFCILPSQVLLTCYILVSPRLIADCLEGWGGGGFSLGAGAGVFLLLNPVLHIAWDSVVFYFSGEE